jgi:hypothetical protein
LAIMDATYRGEWSMARDLRFIFYTFTAGGTGDAANKIKEFKP